MKKSLTAFILALVSVFIFASCKGSSKPEAPIKIGVLKGPTTMGLSKVIGDNKTTDKYSFEIMASPEEIAPMIASGQLDMAAVPSNMASVLYNKTEGKIKVLNINTLGVLHVIGFTDISSIADLKGKTVYASGKGSVPEYALNYILTQNGIDPANDLTISYVSEHAEVLTAITANPQALGLAPEPFVTVAATKNPDVKSLINLSEEWDKLNNGSSLVMGVCVAREEFINNYPNAVKEFMEEYSGSATFTNYNIGEAAAIIDETGILEKAVAEKAIPGSNIVYIDGDDMKQKLSGFLNVLYEQNPESVGGKIPDENFYYKK